MFDINGDGHMDAFETSSFLEATKDEGNENGGGTINTNKHNNSGSELDAKGLIKAILFILLIIYAIYLDANL